MSFICEYCDTKFSHARSMYKHQRTAKYCVAKQKKVTETATAPVFKCDGCEKEFSRRDNLLRHQKICVNDQSDISKKLGNLIDVVSQLLEKNGQNTAQNTSQNTAQNTAQTVSASSSVNMNLLPLTDEDIKRYLDDLSLDFIQEGGRGYASYANIYPLKDRVACTDKSRKKLRYKDKDGTIIYDSGGVKLSQRFFKLIEERNEKIIKEEYRQLHAKVDEIANSESGLDNELTELLLKASNLQTILIKCKAAARGIENDLTRDFVNHLSRLL